MKTRPETGEVDYTQFIATPFEITTPLQTYQSEAGAKGLALIITVGFITLDEFYGQEGETEDDEPDGPDAQV